MTRTRQLFFDEPQRLLQWSISHPLVRAYKHFDKHFANGGGQQHPTVGDLLEFAKKIESCWDAKKGENIVARLIRYKLEPEKEYNIPVQFRSPSQPQF